MHPVMTESADRMGEVKIQELSSLSVKVVTQRGSEIISPWKTFLVAHSGDKELTIFSTLVERKSLEESQPVDRSNVPVVIAVAAFVLTEIKKGFTLAFFLLIPFFVIDLVVANLLVAMGLTMMSPVIVSLPIKLLLFVSSDGWLLLARNLIQAYQ
jgi:flagellar biosynthetic protein FliP